MLARDAICHLCHPFGDVAADQIYDKLFARLTMPCLMWNAGISFVFPEQIRMVQIGLAAPDIMLAGS